MASEAELQKQFAGRVFKDKKSGATIVLSRAAQMAILSRIPSYQLQEMGQAEINQKLTELLGGSEWARWLAHFTDYQKLKAEGKIKDLLAVYKEDVLVFNGNHIAIFYDHTLRVNRLPRIITQNSAAATSESEVNTVHGLSVLWDEQRQIVRADDGYQIRYKLEVNQNGERLWRPILPHERQYVLTPDQQIEYIVKKLKTEKSAYNEPYVFDDYITTKRRDDGVPQIVILVTNTQVSAQEQQWINDWYLNDGKNLTPAQKQLVQALIPKIGNGFTRRQAQGIARWIDQLLDQSEYAREVFRIADVRFIAQDNEGLSKQTGGRWKTKYASGPDHYNMSLWGIGVATYYPEMIPLAIFPHEVGRIYLSQTMGNYDDEKDLGPVEQRLLKEAPPPFSF